MFSFFSKKPASPDGQVIEQLKINGSDLAKPHMIDFFFYIPELEHAKVVADHLEKGGFKVKITSTEGQSKHCLTAQKAMLPDEEALNALRDKFAVVMADVGGEYDGWGCEVVN